MSRRISCMTTLESRILGDEVWVTVITEEGAAARALFEEVREVLEEGHARPLSIRAYGPVSELKEGWRRSGFDEYAPVTWLDSPPPFLGLQVWAVTGNVSTEHGGRLWNGDRFRALLLPGIRGEGPEAPGQAASMLSRAGSALQANGFSWRHVVRTWVYLARLLDWYPDFNRVRTGYFGSVGLGSSTGFPASTGIQGRSGDGEECQMDILAVEGWTTRFIRRSPRQSEAFSYGSAFSRGAVIERGGRRTIHVSGTASIDGEGRTVHRGDAAAQAVQTFDCVAAVLHGEGAGLEHVVSSTLFCRDVAALEAGLKALRTRPRFPVVPVIAQICRDDLLVELEAVAVV